MNSFDNILRALSWTLIHSLWQGLILTILAGVVMLLTRRSVAAIRYNILCILFFSFITAAILTFTLLLNTSTTHTDTIAGLASAKNIDKIFSGGILNNIGVEIGIFLNANAGWIILAWAIILSWKLIRMSVDLAYVYRLRNRQVFSLDSEWKARITALAQKMEIRKAVQLMESALIHVPVVVGHFKPVILLPVGIVNHLTLTEVEAVLLHELAHIRRHDYMVNLIQRVAELFFFFNPGFLWVS